MKDSFLRRSISTAPSRPLLLIALLGASAGAFAQIDGTLFTQPEERAYLDYLRDEFLRNNAEQGFDIEEAAVPIVPGAEDAQPSGPVEFNFGGVMTRRDGSRSVWLNGVVLAESELPGGMSLVSADNGISLRIVHEGKEYLLRPGQTVDLLAGSVMENYQRPQADVSESASISESANVAKDAGAGDATEAVSDSAATGDDESAAEPATGVAATVDALRSAVGELDDSQVTALFEALATLRPASPLDEGDAEEDDEDDTDEAADDDEP
ncbi:MAG: hypothetical protein ACO1PZ_00055 [Gammaproteobacteria bacterium]